MFIQQIFPEYIMKGIMLKIMGATKLLNKPPFLIQYVAMITYLLCSQACQHFQRIDVGL